MKKIIIALAAIATATVVNAAACAWTGAAVSKIVSTDDATSYTMYLLDASVTDAATMSGYLASGDTSYLSAATVTTTSGLAAGTAVRWTSTFGDYTAGDSYTYYTVIFNGDVASADHFMITAEKTASVPASGNLVMAFGTQASNTWNTMAAVPEPTSGLLMLVGLAGLALRRRRA